MKVLVTGATGFVGRHVVDALLARGHQVVASARDEQKARTLPWFDRVKFVPVDIHAGIEQAELMFDSPDAVVHLAWPGLPNYHASFHFEQNLPAAYAFLKALINGGVKHVLVAGTCFEYGMRNGELTESMPPLPENSYAVSKDALRQFLMILSREVPFTLQWARLFYMHGPGQSSRSLLAQLDAAIDRGDKEFPMSGGEQLRDYLPVESVARSLAELLDCHNLQGIVNICSGSPISVRSLTENHIRRRGSNIKLCFGAFPYPAHEPFAFWGSPRRMRGVVESLQVE
jgi:nucleoside-diphosphate-sugar epimerase